MHDGLSYGPPSKPAVRFRNWPPPGLLLVSLLAASLALGCGGRGHLAADDPPGSQTAQPPPPASDAIVPSTTLELAQIAGQIVTDEPFLVFPNRAWRQHQQREVWLLSTTASMVVQVRQPLEHPLILGLVAEDPSRLPCLRAHWDGKEVSLELRSAETGEMGVEIPTAELQPGLHYLDLARCAEQGEEPQPEAATFRDLGYRYPGRSTVLPLQRLANYRFLSDLLTFGVTGSYGREKLAGTVQLEPGRLELLLPSSEGGSFTVKVQNSSFGPGRFSASAGEVYQEAKLEAHSRHLFHLDLPNGVDRVQLEAVGDPNGYFLWGAAHFQPRSAPRRAPVVLISLDTTRRDMLGAYGGPEGLTPNLDLLAEIATVYDNAHSTSPWTLPAHASLFTGLYPSRHGAGRVSDHLESRFHTLAEAMRSGGYLTLGLSGGILTSYRFGNAQGFDLFRDPEGFESPGPVLTRDALELLDTYSDRPFLLFVNYFDPHFPYLPPADLAAEHRVPELLAAVTDPAWQQALGGDSAAWKDILAGEHPPDPRSLAALQASYRAEVASVDREFGRLMAALEERGLLDPAMVVVFSDHGELLGEHGHLSHSARLDPELVDIPLLIKWPRQQEGARESTIVSLVDLMPTLLEIAHIDRESALEGQPMDGIALTVGGRNRLARRRGVAMEEHDAPFHRLLEHRKLGDRLYGYRELDSRRWRSELAEGCAGLQGKDWLAKPCPRPVGEDTFQALELQATQPQEQRIGLTDEERDKLRALGYLR